jgi:hypothetical protein
MTQAYAQSYQAWQEGNRILVLALFLSDIFLEPNQKIGFNSSPTPTISISPFILSIASLSLL